MNSPSKRHARLYRLEEARRQTQRQLDIINRQVTRRLAAIVSKMKPRHASYRRGRPPNQSAAMGRYRADLAAVMAERQPEIDALSQKLAQQDRAIAAHRAPA